MTIKLTKLQRMTLINQIQIIKRLYPEEAESLSEHEEAFRSGYTLHYDWYFDQIYDEVPEEHCRFVLDVLQMYDAIQRCGDEEVRGHMSFKFSGFDGNNETDLMGYCAYFIKQLGRYGDLILTRENDFNSHMPTVDMYERMLKKYRELDLSPASIKDAEALQVLEASRPPGR